MEGLSEFSAKHFIWYSPINIQFMFMQIAVISCRYFCYNSLRLQVFVTPTLWEQHIIISQPVRLLMWLAYEIMMKQSSFYICFYINVFTFIYLICNEINSQQLVAHQRKGLLNAVLKKNHYFTWLPLLTDKMMKKWCVRINCFHISSC